MKNVVALPIATLFLFALGSMAHSEWPPDGVALCTAAGEQWLPEIASDGAGGAIITWRDPRSGTSGDDIYAQRVNFAGIPQWQVDGVGLCTAVAGQAEPAIISDGAGGAIVTWQDDRNGPRDIYAQRVNGLGEAQWTPNGVALTSASSLLEAYPKIVSDGEGGAIVTWTRGLGDIYAQRVNSSGIPQWTAGGVALCTAANLQGNSRIVADGAGGAIVSWIDRRSGTGFDIYTQRVSATGVPQWTADGIALCTAPGDQYPGSSAPDGEGGAIVTWSDERLQSGGDLYVQRVSASGIPQWTVDGVLLCTAPGVQGESAVLSDGAGGAMVTWGDGREADFDIYVQRLSASGVPQWTFNGVALCTAAGLQSTPVIVSDGAGGGIVAWSDGRIDGDIYAQRVDGAGMPQWTADGVALCTAELEQVFPTLVSDGAGGAIATWMDERNGYFNMDIYSAILPGDTPPAGGSLSGKVFDDLDADCSQTGGELGLSGRRVLLHQGSRIATAAGDGSYSFCCVPPGNYTLSLVSRLNWDQTCPPGFGDLLGIVNPGQNLTGLDFGTQPILDRQDLKLSIALGPARPGFELSCGLTYENVGTSAIAAMVVLQVPLEVDYTSSQPAGVYDSNNRTVTWDLGTLTPDVLGNLRARMVVPVDIPLGIILHATADILPLEGEFQPANNTATADRRVRGAYDPNEKSVEPPDQIAPGEWLRYHLDFQNTGNAEAINVVLRDTLDSNLDITTVDFGASSHAHAAVIDGRTLVWTFENINLPDSTADEPGSHGFVEVRVRTEQDLDYGTEIHNRAAIYFDFNPAILTNLVTNTVADPTIDVVEPVPQSDGTLIESAEPNPTTGQIRLLLRLDAASHLTTEVYDAGGRLVGRLQDGFLPAGSHLFRWDGLTGAGRRIGPGVYYVRARAIGAQGQRWDNRRLVVVR